MPEGLEKDMVTRRRWRTIDRDIQMKNWMKY